MTNGIQHIGLAFEPGQGGELHRRPRPPREWLFNRLMVERTVLAAVVMGLIGFAAFAWMLRAGWPEAAARNGLLLLMVLFENVHLGNCRSETRSALRMSPLRNPLLLVSAVAALLVHVAAMHLPVLQRALGTGPLGLRTWAVFLALALILFVAMEHHKWAWGRRGGRRTPDDVGQAFGTPQPAA